MTRTQAIDTIKSKLDEMTDEQVQSLADIAEAYTRTVPAEDAATRAAIAEGVRQAKAGERVPAAEFDQLLKQPWR